MLDLYHAGREDLVDLILAQQDRIADLERQVAQLQEGLAAQRATIAHLTQRLGEVLAALTPTPDPPPDAGARSQPRPPGMPGHKAEPPPRADRPRKQRARGFARRRMPPTARQVHAVARCPRCRIPLTGGSIKRTREVIEVPVVPAVVTEHVYLERRCPGCGGRWVPAPELDGVVCGQGRLGIGLLSLIATLREVGRLPFATIQWYLATLHGLQLSVGALVGAVRTVAARAGPVVAGLRATIRASPVVHADETGWRERGRNGYVWTFSTPSARYFVRGTREKAVLEAALGADCRGAGQRLLRRLHRLRGAAPVLLGAPAARHPRPRRRPPARGRGAGVGRGGA